jgi:DNA-binding NarL/FixJ family response regulator
MALLFIISGILLSIFGFCRIQSQYNYILELKEKELFVSKSNEMQNLKLQEINNSLDTIIKEISDKEIELKAIIDNKNTKESDAFLQSGTNNFKSILDRKYKENDNSFLPEKYKRIFALNKEGLSMEEIAAQLCLGIRETKLILKFYKREADKGA